jgi:zinc transport system substrate-binding protein
VMGHGFQPAVEKAAGQRDHGTLILLDELPISAGDKRVKEGDPSALDPHVWLDPTLMSKVVGSVASTLEKADPARRSDYERNAAAFKDRLAALDSEYARGLTQCARREIVTAHEAFGYLARRYGLKQQGIAGIAPDQEPNAQRLADLADLVRRDHVKVIFTEELVSPRVANALAREAGGVRTETLNPLEGLSDREIAHHEDYVSVMRDNLVKLRGALNCASSSG